MTTAHDSILASVRTCLRRTADSPVPAPPPVPMLGRVDLDASAKLTQFGERLAAVGGHLHLGIEDGGLAAVQQLLARYAPRSIARSNAAAVTNLRDHASLRAQPWQPPDASREELFTADLGVTAAQWAIAETGTLVLVGDEERHRLASLLPPVHIALLPHSRILGNLGEALKTLARPLSPAVTFITGPSRTADIELQLVIGVHGPRELHVVVV
ncbi:MAG TPA: lactate utilization protein [Planctomycetota bacterium]|nr:lactate utilization protein [Planctomycetota bacterium]